MLNENEGIAKKKLLQDSRKKNNYKRFMEKYDSIKKRIERV